MLLATPEIDPADLAARTGWELKPEGLCKGPVCVPLPREAFLDGGHLDATVLARALGAPLLHDEASGLWALGPEAGRPLATALAPDFTLPDVEGRPFTLSSLRGQKVLLVAWASW